MPGPRTAFEDVAEILLFLVRSVSRSPLHGYAFEARADKIEVLNVAGPRESKEPGVYEWTLTVLRFFLSRAIPGAGIHRKSWGADTADVGE